MFQRWPGGARGGQKEKRGARSHGRLDDDDDDEDDVRLMLLGHSIYIFGAIGSDPVT